MNQDSDVQDVSSTFDHYRASARAVWNTAFWPAPQFRSWDSVDEFDEIQRLLFQALVVAKLEREWPLQNTFREAIPFFQIVPTSSTRILIQKPRPGAPTGYWDDPVSTIDPGEAELLFIAYFDWNRMDYIDLQYYRVKISRFDAHRELVGREALIERLSTAVHLIK